MTRVVEKTTHARGEQEKKAHFCLRREMAIEACMEGEGVARGDELEAKGKPLLALEAKLKRWSMCVCVCVHVCVCVRSSTKKLSIKAWDLSHKMN